MRGSLVLRILTICVALMFSPYSRAGTQDQNAYASTILSRYPMGTMPNSDSVVDALAMLGAHGTRRDIGLLKQIIRAEIPEVRVKALFAIQQIRDRQVTQQRIEFRKQISHWKSAKYQSQRPATAGPTEKECVAYAHWLVSARPTVFAKPQRGNAKLMLRQGRTRAALAAVMFHRGHSARMLEGRIREELGDVYGALAVYIAEFADGHPDAREPLESYGVHAERLLLGLLSSRNRELDDTNILNVLVRNGTGLTVSVLTERLTHPTPSERGIAIDALARMLEPSQRVIPLDSTEKRAAMNALVLASTNHTGPIRSIAIEALHEIP